MQKYLIVLFILFLPCALFAQFLPEDPNNEGIYQFIDELASAGVITVNESIKPYSKQKIAQWLLESGKQKDALTPRQQKELDFYSSAYQAFHSPSGEKWVGLATNPLGISYCDSSFRISVHPLINGTLYRNGSATIQNRWWGGALYGTIGKHFSFYATLTDHWETQVLASPIYLTQLTGGKYKNAVNRSGGEYSTMRGGIAWAWNWGMVGFVNDRPIWGSGYNGTNIVSGRNTPFPQLTLKLTPAKWFEFNYMHGWLNSEIIDSSRSFQSANDYKKVYYEKYIAANMITIVPWKSLRISVGNSIIYSSPQAYPGFLIPVLFYRSVDENYTYINNNSQMFFDVNWRPVNKVHLYSSLFTDEFRLSRISKSSQYNLYSIKAGLRTSGWPFDNVIFTAEYTHTTPITYKHKMDVLTFATNNYTLGHYLRDNSEEFFTEVQWKPISRAMLYVSYLNARHCNEYKYINDDVAVTYPVLKDDIWKNTSIATGITYQLFAGTSIKASVLFSNITSVDADGHTAQYYLDMFTPAYLQGKQVTLEGGFSVGF
jgi:hypothetical protein